MEVLDLNYRREEFENILLKPDSFEWHKLYPNNVVPFHEDMEKHLHKGYYLLLFKRINRCRILSLQLSVPSNNALCFALLHNKQLLCHKLLLLIFCLCKYQAIRLHHDSIHPL